MQIRYFSTAWQDVRHSPGWFGRLCLLGLLCLIPVFGLIVLFAYAFGWAREIAWGTHKPMPKQIICNEDGRFWRRGWFIFILVCVFQIIPLVLSIAASSIQTSEVVWTFFGPQVITNAGLEVLRDVLLLVAVVLALIFALMSCIGAMRIAIYDRLSAGFQLGKIVRMFRHDAAGMGRIFGMVLLVGFILGIVLAVLGMLLLVPLALTVLNSLTGMSVSLEYLRFVITTQSPELLFEIIGTIGFFAIVLFVMYLYIVCVGGVFLMMLATRALGYWTMGFDVAFWGGQDDPMPFELTPDPDASERVDIPLPNTPAQRKMQVARARQPERQPVGQPEGQASVAQPAQAPTAQPAALGAQPAQPPAHNTSTSFPAS